MSLSELIAEIMFIKQILKFLRLKVKYLFCMNIDNVRAIFLANDKTTRQKMKHIDVCYHYVCEFVEDGVVKIMFVRSMNN